jgi:5'-3' exonuclease
MAKKPRKYGVLEEITNTLLVDGNALFKFGFYGAKDLYSKDGNHIGGLYQFITIIRKLLRDDLFHRVFVFWDGEFSGRQRYNIYKDYKISRGKDYLNGTHPIELNEVMEKFLIRQYLEELCIRQLIDNSDFGVEADDYIAYYCVTKNKNEKITICTSDRDLCQLISKDIKLYLCDKKEYVTQGNYQTFFKHHQSNSKLIKIIGGDSSDSIKGITNVKETTLLKYFPELIKRQVTLKEIIESAKVQQENRIKENKKPLIALTNIAESITDGIQGKRVYEINSLLVDLTIPLVDKVNADKVEALRGPMGDMDERGIKNVYAFMKRDGVDKVIDTFSTSYLMPFKELIEREKKQQLIKNY